MNALYASNLKPLIDGICERLMKIYWGPLYHVVQDNPRLITSIPGFLIKPDKIIFYVGKTHIGIEYIGSERIDKLEQKWQMEIQYFHYTQSGDNFLEKIVGFQFDGTGPVNLPLPPFVEDLILPTNAGFDKLVELKWNFDAQDAIWGFNSGAPIIPENQFARIVNGFFFDADETGLKTRHVKWIDFIPIGYDDSGEKYDSFQVDLNPYKNFVEQDASYTYPLPEDFKYEKLPRINRFVELIGNRETTETQITSFLAEDSNQFILTMRFGAEAIYSEVVCEWQTEDKNKIRPDFFVVQPDGYADIVEFKLPEIKTSPMVGRPNRETFSSELNSYISQTRVYRNYFDDPNNRSWFENKYGFKVHNPRRILIAGRRNDFSSDDWREIVADYSNITILTYDDLIDGVVAQFYI